MAPGSNSSTLSAEISPGGQNELFYSYVNEKWMHPAEGYFLNYGWLAFHFNAAIIKP